MAVTAKWYGTPLKNLFDGTAVFDWNTDAIKCSLHSGVYVPNQDTHDFFDDATNELATGGGYTAGGKTLTTPVVTYDAASNQVRLAADDVQWTAATFTARYAVVRKDTGTPATSPLLFFIDFGGDESVSNGAFTINFDATGACKVIVSG